MKDLGRPSLYGLRRTVGETAHKFVEGRVYSGKLAEEYDGLNQFVLVQLSGGSPGAALAQVPPGVHSQGKKVYPAGTPVHLLQTRGTLEVTSLGASTPASTYVPLVSEIKVFNSATTTVSQTLTPEVTDLPAGQVVAVHGVVIASCSSSPTVQPSVFVRQWGESGESLAGGVYLPLGANTSNVTGSFTASVGGTNERQLRVLVIAGTNAGTITYYVFIVGYWTRV